MAQKHCLAEYRAIPHLPSRPNSIAHRENIVIPVVFHVVWIDSIERIDDDQILSQLSALNKDFQGLNTDLSEVPAEFRNDIGVINFEFCLATIDPSGNPSLGIDYTQTVIEHIGIHRDADNKRSICYDNSGGVNAWDPNKFVNIWIGDMDGFLGLSSFPRQGPLAEDGIIIDPHYIGTNRLAFSNPKHNLGRTLTHEMGHYFNLQHPWGTNNGTCESDDDISDTPVQSDAIYGCPAYPYLSCGHSAQFMNFMNYTDDACLLMFTAQQKLRMLETLDLWRHDLLSTASKCSQFNISDNWEISIWPNPNQGQFTCQIKDDAAGRFQVNILDHLGRKLAIGAWENGEIRGIDRSDLPAGLYLLQVSRESRVETQRFCIFHTE